MRRHFGNVVHVGTDSKVVKDEAFRRTRTPQNSSALPAPCPGIQHTWGRAGVGNTSKEAIPKVITIESHSTRPGLLRIKA